MILYNVCQGYAPWIASTHSESIHWTWTQIRFTFRRTKQHNRHSRAHKFIQPCTWKINGSQYVFSVDRKCGWAMLCVCSAFFVTMVFIYPHKLAWLHRLLSAICIPDRCDLLRSEKCSLNKRGLKRDELAWFSANHMRWIISMEVMRLTLATINDECDLVDVLRHLFVV